MLRILQVKHIIFYLQQKIFFFKFEVNIAIPKNFDIYLDVPISSCVTCANKIFSSPWCALGGYTRYILMNFQPRNFKSMVTYKCYTRTTTNCIFVWKVWLMFMRSSYCWVLQFIIIIWKTTKKNKKWNNPILDKNCMWKVMCLKNCSVFWVCGIWFHKNLNNLTLCYDKSLMNHHQALDWNNLKNFIPLKHWTFLTEGRDADTFLV